ARIGWGGGSAGACRTERGHMIYLVSTQTIAPQNLAVRDIERMARGKVGLRQIGLAQYSCRQQRRVASAEPNHCIGPESSIADAEKGPVKLNLKRGVRRFLQFENALSQLKLLLTIFDR